MNRDELLYKWLNHELNADELEAFQKLEDFHQLNKLGDGVKKFKAPDYNTSEELHTVLKHIGAKKSNKRNWFAMAASIAAIFIVCIGFYFYSTSVDTTFSTLMAQKETIQLPDGSLAQLNAMSELSFNKHQWRHTREIELQGEAYFKVAKGSTFKVVTPVGTVTVLGTQFNIKQRNDYFEVVCYEGFVNVNYSTFDVKITPGNSFIIRGDTLITSEKTDDKTPSWIKNYSHFKSIPYKEVLAEFERQYDVKIKLESVDASQFFTGSFVHNDIQVALKSITLPLQLTYQKTNRTILLKRE